MRDFTLRYFTMSGADFWSQRFENNQAIASGAVHADGAPAHFDNTVFINNGGPETTAGGAVTFSGPVEPKLSNCYFENNTAMYGGAVFLASRSTAQMDNCTFVGNNALYQGGAVYMVPAHQSLNYAVLDC